MQLSAAHHSVGVQTQVYKSWNGLLQTSIGPLGPDPAQPALHVHEDLEAALTCMSMQSTEP